ncbi:cysteine proteinase [Meredithblackwellia eburnea MCA 4105]
MTDHSSDQKEPPPPQRRSYAATASGSSPPTTRNPVGVGLPKAPPPDPPKPVKGPLQASPAILAPVESSTFFTPQASSSSAPTRKPSQKKVAAAKAYVEIDDEQSDKDLAGQGLSDDDIQEADDESAPALQDRRPAARKPGNRAMTVYGRSGQVTRTTAATHNPRGSSTTGFRPATSTYGDENEWGVETSAAKSTAMNRTSSSSRSRTEWAPPPPAASPSGWYDEDEPKRLRGRSTNRSLTLWKKKEHRRDEGWTVDKILAMDKQDAGKQGCFSGSLLAPALEKSDFDLPTNAAEAAKTKWRELGSFVAPLPPRTEQPPPDVEMKTAATSPTVSAASEVDQVMDSPKDSTTARAAPEDPDFIIIDADNSSNQNLHSSTAPPAPPPVVKPAKGGFFIPSWEEILTARPHPHAYFHPSTLSWVLCAPLPDNTDLEVIGDSSPYDCWWPVGDTPVSLTELAEPWQQPFPRALGYTSKDEYKLDVKNRLDVLNRIESGVGRYSNKMQRTVAISEEDWFPSVIGAELWSRFVKKIEPAPNVSKRVAELNGVGILWRSIDSLLFRGESRSLPTNGNTFRKNLAFNDECYEIWINTLGFHLEPNGDGGNLLTPPKVDHRIPEQAVLRRRLLRCWLEIGLWLEHHRKTTGPETNIPVIQTRIKYVDARPILRTWFGGIELPKKAYQKASWLAANGYDNAADEYELLGVTPNHSDEVILALYHDQTFVNPGKNPEYLAALQSISRIRDTTDLQMALAQEKSKHRWTYEDLHEAYKSIGLTNDVSTLDEETIMVAMTAHISDAKGHMKSALVAACTIIAKSRNSDFLASIVNSMSEEERPKMTLTKAYTLLQIEDELPDEMIKSVATIRVSDSPGQKEQLLEAVGVIAEHRNSQELRRYLKGDDEWEAMPMTSVDRPVGLTNIANTCYLNSLLQYFFTVRDLRETILRYAPDADKESDGLRVGNRLVTKAEVERSRRFAVLLQGLFNQLIHSATTAVTPETELAYLALVPSKEESLLSMDAEPTLMDVSPAPPSPANPLEMGSKSPTVLGKRTSEHLDDSNSGDLNLESMQIDSQLAKSPLVDNDSNRMEPSPPRQTRSRAGTEAPAFDENSANPLSAKEGPDGVVEIGGPDVEMTQSLPPPPLPPRKTEKPDLEKQVSTYMSFGKQNDVTECMDNVMFQLECALNSDANPEDSSLVKRLFYGKMKQQLEIEDPAEAEPVRSTEEPFFSLLVDVAEEGRSIYDGLDTVFDDAQVEIEGKRARRRISLVDAPPILHVQLQRVQYDRVAQKVFKSNAHLSFGDTIAMDRYLEVDPANEAAVERRDRTGRCRQELEQSRTRLQELVQSKGADMNQILKEVRSHAHDCGDFFSDFLDEADGDEEEAADLHVEITSLNQRIEDLRSEIEAVWIDQESSVYELVSVFIHRGSASSGHYYIYQRDSKNTERWLKYNDSLVTDIDPKEEVFRETTGDANAYFLVYCRRDRLDEIESLKRDP